jgi:AcrR family transcriptional regulator
MALPVTARGMETRERLLTAAEKVFGKKSYYRVSISDITREAGVGQGTFYLYFPSKEAAFRELVQVRAHEMRRVMHLATEGAANRIEAERAGFAAFFQFVARHRSLYKIVRQAEFVDEELYREFYQAIANGYRAGLQAAMQRGEITQADPEVLAYCLMGIGDFVGLRWIVWEHRTIPTAVFEDMMHFIEHGLLGSTSAVGEKGGIAEE